jgi:hypothetical protein
MFSNAFVVVPRFARGLAMVALLTSVESIPPSVVHAAEPANEGQWFAGVIKTYNNKSFCVPGTVPLLDVATALQQYAKSHQASDTLTTAQTVQILAQLYPCRPSSVGKNVVVPPTGEYATIDTRQSIALIRTLGATSGHENDSVIENIKAHSDAHPPPVFFALARLLYQRGDVDDAIFWFNAGRLRGNFDALRCTDISARSAISALVFQIPAELRKAQFADMQKLRTIITSVISWDEATPHNYDQRWINLHGMEAMKQGLGDPNPSSVPLSVAQEKWDGLAKQARDDYRKGLEEAIAAGSKPQK